MSSNALCTKQLTSGKLHWTTGFRNWWCFLYDNVWKHKCCLQNPKRSFIAPWPSQTKPFHYPSSWKSDVRSGILIIQIFALLGKAFLPPGNVIQIFRSIQLLMGRASIYKYVWFHLLFGLLILLQAWRLWHLEPCKLNPALRHRLYFGFWATGSKVHAQMTAFASFNYRLIYSRWSLESKEATKYGSHKLWISTFFLRALLSTKWSSSIHSPVSLLAASFDWHTYFSYYYTTYVVVTLCSRLKSSTPSLEKAFI